jgi:chitinase
MVVLAVMKCRSRKALLCLASLCVLGAKAGADPWTTAYYPGYHQSTLPTAQIDFTVVSHIIHFSVTPNADGTLDTSANGITAAHSADVVARAHAAGRKVLICVGGADSAAGFQGATTSANLASFIGTLVDFMSSNGYDGVDLDWEPLLDADAGSFTGLVNGLRSALDQISPRPLLTVATASEPALFAALQNQFDQINLMTYDLAGPYEGWVTWFNAPIYDGGYRFPSNGKLIPSADGMVTNFIGSGVLPGKLAIGLCFYGRVWTDGAGTPTGGTLLPRQSWTTAPTVTAVTYSDIMANYYQPDLYHWDDAAQAAYLSITNPVAANDIFLSYDDEHTCQAKVSYARNQHLGGVMIWELSQGHRATQPVGQRDPLLQAVKQALATPGPLAIQLENQAIELSFTGAPLGLYRVMWSSDLSANLWNTLTNNVPGTNGVVVVTDSTAATSQPQRFYRVQTPP